MTSTRGTAEQRPLAHSPLSYSRCAPRPSPPHGAPRPNTRVIPSLWAGCPKDRGPAGPGAWAGGGLLTALGSGLLCCTLSSSLVRSTQASHLRPLEAALCSQPALVPLAEGPRPQACTVGSLETQGLPPGPASPLREQMWSSRVMPLGGVQLLSTPTQGCAGARHLNKLTTSLAVQRTLLTFRGKLQIKQQDTALP